MTRTVGVGVGALRRGVADVTRIDGDPSRLLLGRPIDLVVGQVLRQALLRLDLGNGSRERCLAMVHMPDGAHIAVWPLT